MRIASPLILWFAFAAGLQAGPLHLRPETLAAWDAHLQAAESRATERNQGPTFLWIEEDPERMRRVAAGEILVSPVDPHTPKGVPHGLIHDWIGAAFIPNAKLDDVFAVVRDYERYKEFYKPGAIDSKELSHDGDQYGFSVTLANKAVVLKTGVVTEGKATYLRLDDKRWYCVVKSTQIHEIENLGQPNERHLPPDEGNGFIWRLASFSRFEERDGGVYVELEAIVLSRDVPAAFRLFVNPLVRNLSRGALITSLRQSSQAVQAQKEKAAKSPPAGKSSAADRL
jgi:hypothetical protein